MDEYISRKSAIEGLSAEALERNLDSVMTDDAHRYHRAAERVIVGVPAADVRPVVLCRDCKHGQGEKMDFWNEYVGIECIGGVVHRKDWFCADGEKREES